MTTMIGKTRSLGLVSAAYLAAIAVGGLWLWWGPTIGRLWLDTLIADILATLVIFVFSRVYRNSSFYDAFWSVIPPLLLFYWWYRAAPDVDLLRAWMITIVVVLWAIRLTANWVYAFPGLHHEDWRYPMFKERAGRFELLADLVAIHLIPTLQVFLAMVPVYIAITRPEPGLVWLSWLALVVGLAAIALELVADAQMHRFVAERQTGQAMDRGVWSWSRHPNYFGEFSFWVALALFGIAAAPSYWWLSSLGAVAILAMFLGASIPMMEERSLTRRPAYQDVIDRVSRFVPRPPHARNV